jgi:hypothetical protein
MSVLAIVHAAHDPQADISEWAPACDPNWENVIPTGTVIITIVSRVTCSLCENILGLDNYDSDENHIPEEAEKSAWEYELEEDIPDPQLDTGPWPLYPVFGLAEALSVFGFQSTLQGA